jgi:hypothetical protein
MDFQKSRFLTIIIVNLSGCVASILLIILMKTTFTILVLFLSGTCFAQLNPVKNLYWHQWYSNPNNFFELNWSVPDTSLTDTLVGYNIYRNNTLYRFQTATSVHHIATWDTDCGEDFVYNFTPPFYFHVSAVYNINHLVSPFNDSAACLGGMVGLNSIEIPAFSFGPNPISENTVIHINLPDRKVEYLTILNAAGQVIYKSFPGTNEYDFRFDSLHLKNGLYILILHGDSGQASYKFIKTD